MYNVDDEGIIPKAELDEKEEQVEVENKKIEKIKVIGSLSARATKLLDDEMPKIEKDDRLIIVADQPGKDMIEIISNNPNSVIYNDKPHLEKNKALETWCISKDINIFVDFAELLRTLTEPQK